MNENRWIKFNHDDGASIYYRINTPDENNEIKIDFKVEVEGEVTKELQLYDNEIEEVYYSLAKLKS